MTQDQANLDGKRIVVVEDDFMLATDICRELRSLGATVLGPAPTPFYAMQLINRRHIDAAVLDVRLHGATVFEVAEVLQSRGVPIIFATAYDRAALPDRFHHETLLEKPLDRTRLLAELRALLDRPRRPAPVQPWPEPVMQSEPYQPAQSFARALARGMQAT